MAQENERTARRFLLGLLIGSLVLMVVVVRPIAGALLVAAVLAVALWPAVRWLRRLFPGGRNFPAALLTAAVLLVLVVPFALLSAVVVKESGDALRFIFETVRSEGVAGLVQALPAGLQEVATRALAYLGDLDQLVQQHLAGQGGKAASAVGAAISGTGAVLFNLAMMLIALFFLLAAGDRLVAWIDEASPLRPGETRELFAEFRAVSSSVIVSTLVTAGAQALVALVGYLIAKVPHPGFFAAVTFFVAMIPAIGAASVCLFAALILFLTGHPYMAAFLAAWGMTVVALIDNVVKPYLIKGRAEMSGAVVFFALVGGIAAFGIVGLVLGPLCVALFLAVLRIYQRDYVTRSAGGGP